MEPRPPTGQRSKKTRASKKKNNYAIETIVELDEFLEQNLEKKKKNLVTLEANFIHDHQPPVVTLRKARRKRVESMREYRIRCNKHRHLYVTDKLPPHQIKTNAFEESITRLPPSRGHCEDINLPNIRAQEKGVERVVPQPPKLPNISTHRRRRNLK